MCEGKWPLAQKLSLGGIQKKEMEKYKKNKAVLTAYFLFCGLFVAIGKLMYFPKLKNGKRSCLMFASLVVGGCCGG